MRLQTKILAGYLVLVAVICSMAAILVHERGRMHEIETEAGETCHPCTHRDAEKERHRRGFWRQEDRADTALRQGTAPVQRQPDSHAAGTDEIVSGDRNRIISIGGNLLSNAIKFTRSGTVTLSTGYKNGIFTLTVAAWAEQRRTGYPKATFAQGLMDMGFHLVSRLRDDANLMYIYNGKPIGKRGRPKVYGEKIDFDNLDYSKMERIETDSEDEELYTLVAYSKAMKRNIRLVIWRSSIGKHKLYFSTDIDMSGKEVIEFYRTRFQIEFCYRDAKQYTGLYHSQARDERKLDFAFNASFTAINAAKIMMKQYDVPFSVESLKSLIFNSYLLDRFFKLSGVRPNKRINAKLVKELIDIAAYRAA